MRPKELLSKEYLQTIFTYDPISGNLHNKKTGKKLGAAFKNGYLYVSINNEKFLQHRIIYQMVYGWCPAVIDHVSGDPKDNSLKNLRSATSSQNNANREIAKNNTSGATGVSWVESRNKWVAKLNIERKHIFLGYYDILEEAIYVRRQAEKKYFQEFARKRFDSKVELLKTKDGFSVEIDFQENLSAKMQFENHELFSAIQAYEKASAIYIESNFGDKLN